jgi:Fe-S-cluster containining protein
LARRDDNLLARLCLYYSFLASYVPAFFIRSCSCRNAVARKNARARRWYPLRVPSLPLAQSTASPCDTCLAGCCRGHNLVIRGSDAVRISRERGLQIADFAELAWCAPDEPGSIALDPSEPGHRFRLQLRQVDEVHGAFTERCTFLDTIDGRGRCAIYESRPAMCRAYPTTWREGTLAVATGPFCPPGSWSLPMLDVPLQTALHEEKQRLAALDATLAEEWNGRLTAAGKSATREEYVEFLASAWAGRPLRFTLVQQPVPCSSAP